MRAVSNSLPATSKIGCRCFDRGLHQRSDPSGRFNQQHRPEHEMEEMPQVDTVLHQLQRAHPELSVGEIMQRVQAAQE